MSRQTAFASILVSAVIAAAILAAVFASNGNPSATAVPLAGDAVQSELTDAYLTAPTPAERVDPPVTFAELTRSSVDWAAVYARAVPSLVSVVSERGSGSGFFVTEDGHVITNFHVVSNTGALSVYLQDGSRLEAEFVAKDAGNDLALLKVDADAIDIVVPVFGAVDDLRIGDPVGALGAPFSLPNSLTVGIVSALDRQRPSGNGVWQPMRSMIQTDAALNPGNSGGMLIDEHARVIGIPTQIESPDRASSGIGFAVSADTLLRALPTLIAGEDYEQSFLGVTVQEGDDGLEILDALCGLAAAESGVRTGDRLLRINGESVGSLDGLSQVLSEIRPGEEIAITVQRGSRQLMLDATITAWPTERPLSGCG